jgi:hypothetical protein
MHNLDRDVASEQFDQAVSGAKRGMEMGGTGLEPVTPSYAS